MPYAQNFFLSHIEVDFRLEDGTTRTLKTIVSEREVAQAKYNDAITQGQTAVISYMQDVRQSKNMLRVMLGNFPARSKALLKAYCVQQLEFEDQSYCFRLPLVYVPAYMGSVSQYVTKGVSF